MSIKITYKTASNDRSIKNYVLFSDEEFKINGLHKLSISKSSNQINKLIISNKSKKKDFISFNLNSDQKVILIKIKNKLTATDNEKKGANFYNYLKSNLIFNVTFLNNNKLNVELLNSIFWLDTGTHDALVEASNFIKTVEQREGKKVSCLEEIAYKYNYINSSRLKDIISNYNNEYAEYLKTVLDEHK